MNKSDREPIKLFDGFDFDIYNSYLKPQSKKNNNNNKSKKNNNNIKSKKNNNNNNNNNNRSKKNNKNERKDVKVIYPSIFIQEVQLYYGSDGEISDILYLVCLRGDIRPRMNPDDIFLVELRLNPIIEDLFEILIEDKKVNNLKTGDMKNFADNLTSKKFVEMINQKMANKLKIFRRFVFGNEEYVEQIKNINLTNTQIREMDELERASLNLFFVKSSGLGRAFKKLQTMYEESNINRFNDSNSEFTIDKLEKLLEAKEKIDIMKSSFRTTPIKSQKSKSRTLKRIRQPTTPGNPYPITPLGKNLKINPNTVSTVLLNRNNQSQRTQINNSEPPPSPQF
jgi:hypothetical protein